MIWTFKQCIFATAIIIIGTIDTILSKYEDDEESRGSDGKIRKFSHPFVQAWILFLGELLCGGVIYLVIRKWPWVPTDAGDNNSAEERQDYSRWILLIPASLDMCGTILCYYALNLTYASSLPMFHGACIVFVSFLSSRILDREYTNLEKCGIGAIGIGLVVAVFCDYFSRFSGNLQTTRSSFGDLFIIGAQLFFAFQIVYEEKYLKEYDIPPHKVIGMEGLFGFVFLTVMFIPLYFLPTPCFNMNARGVFEDVFDAFAQLGNNKNLAIMVLCSVASSGLYRYTATQVIKERSAMTEIVIDSFGSILVWIVSMIFQWQSFTLIRLVGFLCAFAGMIVYIITRFWSRHNQIQDEEATPPLGPENGSAETEPLIDPTTETYSYFNTIYNFVSLGWLRIY